jgi:hypothetical protein
MVIPNPPSFAAVLARQVEGDRWRVSGQSPPIGSYRMSVVDFPIEDVTKGKKTPFLQFSLRYLEALNADKAALAEWLGDYALTDLTYNHRYYLTDKAAWRLVKFLDDLGAGNASMKISDRLFEAIEKEVFITFDYEEEKVRIKSTGKMRP